MEQLLHVQTHTHSHNQPPTHPHTPAYTDVAGVSARADDSADKRAITVALAAPAYSTGAGVSPVTDLTAGAYIGRWYQTYASASVKYGPTTHTPAENAHAHACAHAQPHRTSNAASIHVVISTRPGTRVSATTHAHAHTYA